MSRKIIIEKAFSILEQEMPYSKEFWIELLTKRRQPICADEFKEIPGVTSLDKIRLIDLKRIYKFVREQYVSKGYDWNALENDLIVHKYSQAELDEMKRVREENREKNTISLWWANSELMAKGT